MSSGKQVAPRKASAARGRPSTTTEPTSSASDESEFSDVPSGTSPEKGAVGESAVKKLPRVILKLGPAPAG